MLTCTVFLYFHPRVPLIFQASKPSSVHVQERSSQLSNQYNPDDSAALPSDTAATPMHAVASDLQAEAMKRLQSLQEKIVGGEC